jgi:periplasmic divalent cation tolerance protein
MDTKLSIVTTTTETYDAALSIARTLLSARLAACVQIAPIRSCYIWKEELREEEEFLLQIKARTQDYEALAAAIRRAHSYEVPEILRLDVDAGDKSYLEWAFANTRRD